MADYQVTCVNKPNRNSPHEHITHIGGAGWRITREEAIRQIDSGQNRFYTRDSRNPNVIAWVGVVREPNKVPYLRTHADGRWTDNLLSLDECPIR